MKYLLPFLLLFTLSATAGIIPAFDLEGNAETGADSVNLTDITSLGAGIGSTTFVFESEVGSGNSGASRSFGFALFNPNVPGSALGIMEIFNSSQLMGGVNFESVVWDANLQTVDNGTVSFALLPTTVLGFYFDSDGETFV